MDKKRNIQSKVDGLLKMFPAVAILGPRQCGKSTLVNQTRPNWKYYDLENINDFQLITNDPVSFFELNPTNLILDEAQQYPDLFKVLRGVIDKNRDEKGRFIITGSSSPEIVKGLAESLAGRVATIELWPFKSNEFYEKDLSSFYQIFLEGSAGPEKLLELEQIISLKELYEFWFSGGYPEPVIQKGINPDFYKIWMDNYFNDYIRRDIQYLFPRLNVNNYRRFLLSLANFSGHQINVSEIARAIEVSSVTVKDYLDIVHSTFLWRNLPVYEKNRLKKVQKMSKGHFRDQGILMHSLRIQTLDDLLLHPVAGYSFESFVIEEIIKGFQSLLTTNLDFTYYRTIDKSEIDLIIEAPFGTVPVEVKLSSKLNKKEIRGLEMFLDDMNLPLGILVNTGQRIERMSQKVIAIPANYL